MAHRRVKDISYDDDDDDEFADGEYEDDGDAQGTAESFISTLLLILQKTPELTRNSFICAGLTPEDEEKMIAGAVAVRAELEETGGAIGEKEIRDALWYYYFDVGKSVDYLRRMRSLEYTIAESTRRMEI